MALANVTASPTFPEGFTLGAYPQLLWAGPPPQPGDSPRTALVDSATVDDHGFALFEALDDNTTYYIGGQVGTWQWRTIRTLPASGSSGGGGGGGLSEAQIKAIIASEDLVGSKIRDLGSRAGAVVTDLDEGRVFLINATADLSLQNPTNTPANGAATYVEYRIVTNGHKVSLPGLTKWSSGETPAGLDGSAAQVNIMVATYNNGASYEGLSSDNLPANVVRLAPGTAGQLIGSDGTKWTAVAPVSIAGLQTQEQVDARIKALSILTGAHPMTYSAPTAPGQVAITNSTAAAAYADLLGTVLPSVTRRIGNEPTVINSTQTIAKGGQSLYYRIGKKAVVATLPPADVAADGELLIIENVSEGANAGAAKVKGPIGSAVVIEREIQPGEALIFWGKEGLTEWRLIGRSRVEGDVVVPDINTTALTSAAITKAFEESFGVMEKAPRNGQMIVDNTNKKVLFYNLATKKWLESAAFTVI